MWSRRQSCWCSVRSSKRTWRPQQYGFRPGMDAKMAVRRAYFHITQHDPREVVDADLSDYFTTIPHGPLMRCREPANRRRGAVGTQTLAHGTGVGRTARERILRTTEARDQKRGTPQGGTASPLLANLYFRRFLLAWYEQGTAATRCACGQLCRRPGDLLPPGNGAAAREMRQLIGKLGLKVNDRKTRTRVRS